MTAHNIIKSLSRRGNTVVGVGCYAAALKFRSNTTKIIKIGSNITDPWLDYYRLIVKTNQSNVCIPKVSSLYIDYEHNFYLAIMEKLNQSCDNNEVKHLIEHYTSEKISKEQFVELASSYPNAIPNISDMLVILDQIVYHSLHPEHKDAENIIRIDLHSFNILSRDCGALVITDPWCHTDELIEDISSLDEWYDHILC
jgi:hypothetical protein